MHNRVRMIVASFLVKDLHLPWWWGARHFMEHLIDGDIASNQHNWQWVAGSGTDASPFFRVFNPMTQAKKFDPDGDYVAQVRDRTRRASRRSWTTRSNARWRSTATRPSKLERLAELDASAGPQHGVRVDLAAQPRDRRDGEQCQHDREQHLPGRGDAHRHPPGIRIGANGGSIDSTVTGGRGLPIIRLIRPRTPR